MSNQNPMNYIEKRKGEIQETLNKILQSPNRLGPDQFLMDKYVSYINQITCESPTAELANFGMRLMHQISLAISEDTDGDRRWLSDLSSKTCAYFKFEIEN